jgi:hypothetical protein
MFRTSIILTSDHADGEDQDSEHARAAAARAGANANAAQSPAHRADADDAHMAVLVFEGFVFVLMFVPLR